MSNTIVSCTDASWMGKTANHDFHAFMKIDMVVRGVAFFL